LIDFHKYLNCPNCKEVEFYCSKHRAEVENLARAKGELKMKIYKKCKKMFGYLTEDNPYGSECELPEGHCVDCGLVR